MVTSAQLRAARAMLKLTVNDVARCAGVGRSTVTRAEDGPVYPPIGARNLAKIEMFLKSMGVRFEGEATRLSEH